MMDQPTIDSEKLKEQLYEAMLAYLKPGLAVADEASQIIKDQAILENQDVDGNPLPQKQARPKGNPKNFPNRPLVQSGNMMDNSRWKVEEVSETEKRLVYDPPDYFDYVVAKRPWLTADKVNPNAVAQIQARMKEIVEGS